jgi:hypothetical protein
MQEVVFFLLVVGTWYFSVNSTYAFVGMMLFYLVRFFIKM